MALALEDYKKIQLLHPSVPQITYKTSGVNGVMTLFRRI